MQGDEKLAKMLPRFEPVEQTYDGLGGSIIKWTMEQGSKSDHPSILAFVVGTDGKATALLDDGSQYQAASFVKWAERELEAYEKLHPSTRLPFVRAKVTVSGEGDDATATCAALDEARDAGGPVAVYFGRGSHDEDDKAAKKEVKDARKFETKVLDSKSAEKQADGWTFLRLDLADPDHARLAKELGVTSAPTLLLFPRGGGEPEVHDKRMSGSALASRLRKLNEEPEPATDE